MSDGVHILDTIRPHKIPLKRMPSEGSIRDNRLARNYVSFVENEIGLLLKKGVINISNDEPHIVNPLTVAYSRSGKPRLVLDCRHINEFLHTCKRKYENIEIGQQIFDLSSFVFTFDLISAYKYCFTT